jgi:ATF/CREB family transcription factor
VQHWIAAVLFIRIHGTNIIAADTSRTNSPLQTKTALPASQLPATSQIDDAETVIQATEPLAPPPRPAQANPPDPEDYFSSLHNGGSHFEEPNVFEQSFGLPSTETPGKGLLPSVAALTSPALPGSRPSQYEWQNSLRSGPLSPAMLPGPTGSTGDYFDNIGRGFPTPNESSLRTGLTTGLTPGGGGSMFPAPSPNSQAIFQQLQSGGATPGTLEFHRTAMNAAARSKSNHFTSNPQDHQNQNMDQKQQNDSFAQHDANDAANGLFMLAKGGQGNNQFAIPQQPVQAQAIQAKPSQQDGPRRGGRNNAGGSIGSISGQDMSGSVASPESHEEVSRPNTRGGRGKKTAKAQATTNGRRKADDTPKAGANKRSKGNSGAANVDPMLEPHDDDDDESQDQDDEEQLNENGKKMTDEEKRRNFLERNRYVSDELELGRPYANFSLRVAALKCRQRKKQWLANLQAKVEMYSAENDTLNSQVQQLHDEIRNLRTLLMGHKDCPVGHAQGIGAFLNGMGEGPGGFANQHVNPYGMAMQNGGGMQSQMQQGR